MHRRAVCLLFLLLISWFGYSQQLPSRTYSTAEGLPNNAIRSLLLDSRGILWIGTENGISKFENGLFQNFYEEDGLAFNSCWAIAEDKNHHLWFGSYGGGLTFFNGKEFRKIQESDGLADNRIRHFYPYQNSMLVGTEDGISIIDLQSLEVSTIPSSAKGTDLNYTTGFWEADGKLFYSTYRSGSYEIFWENGSPKTRKINDWLPIYGVFQEGENLLLADKGSLKTISQADFEAGKSPSISQPSSIFWKKVLGPNEETFLLAAGLFTKDGGIFQYEKGQLKDLNEQFGIDSKYIQAGALDTDRGLLFLGSQDKGLYQVRIDGTLNYDPFEEREVIGIAGRPGLLGFLHPQGIELRPSNRERIVINNAQFKAVQQNYYRQNPEKIPEHMDGFFELEPSIKAEDLEYYELHYRDSFFWTNTNLGVFKLDESGNIRTYLPVHCYSMGFTPNGKLLETNPYAGVRIYENPDTFSYTYFHPDEAHTPLQIAKVVTGKDRTYLASVFHGFYQWEGDGFRSYLVDGIWEEEKFKSLHQIQSNGDILVGTEFGELYRIKPYPEFKILKHWGKDELQGSSILGIETYENVIIVITEKGIHLLDGDKNSFLDDEQGFYQKVFHSAKRIGDQLYLGTNKGFYQVDLPRFTKNKPQDISLGITELKINHEPISKENFDWFVFQGKRLELKSDQNTLFIRFKPTGALYSEKLTYRYRLKKGAEWTEYFTEPIMELPYMPWGIYDLEVEVWDYHSGVMQLTNLISFQIDRPIYLKAWFIGLLVLSMAGIFLFVYRVRSAKFRAETRINQRLTELKLEALRSQMNPHFTFNAINSIQYFILKNDQNQALNYLGKFSALIRLTLDQSSKSQISLREELDYLKKYIEVENMRMDDRVNWEIAGNALEKSEEIFIPPMLIQPLVENVFVHAFPVEHQNPRLSIRYELGEDSQLICTVEDNGIGISQSSSSHESRGTRLIREKLMLLPGYSKDSLKISSGSWGTKVEVRIFYSS
ncbi:sensor histidine kinase [Algoriphagus formosus]|uniref:Signal transduction histidine kinase internal region domain-containing protein n=1 Tax=Algoriphagus formosus TaxID=2007308 RepID=A0A4V6PM24_9BACT|nr:histidine kinase [Algoriphagus aquimaris]TDK42847.1 hypothetical protein E1898_15565 [Algoriphagus aquimaris]